MVSKDIIVEYTYVSRSVQQTRRLAQPGQPARVRPAATQSDDSSGRTRVLNSLTQPHAGRLSVFPFETRDTRPESNPFSFRWVITNFQPVSAKSSPDPSRSSEISPLSNEIWARSRRIRLDIDESVQISAWSRQISTDLVRFQSNLARFRPWW